MLILVLTIVSIIAHYSRQHCWLWSAALPTIVGTKNVPSFSVFFVWLFEIHSNTVKIPFKWYLNITKHILPLHSVKDLKVICTIIWNNLTFNYFSFWNKKSIFVDELIYNSISFCQHQQNDCTWFRYPM